MENDTKTFKLSIIVPVYRVEKYLAQCVDSILSQTYRDFELILVDDGSPDRCGEICDEYQKAFPQKIKVVHKENGGLSDARNAGLEIASGEYISFIDSDDVILPDMFEKMMDKAVSSRVDIIFSQFLTWEGNLKTKRWREDEFECSGNEALALIYEWKENVSVCTKVFHRDAIGKIRFRFGKTNEDMPFVSEILQKTPKVAVLPQGFYRYRVTPGSITNVIRPSFFDIFDNIEYVEKFLDKENLELRKAFDKYILTMHINSGIRIVKSHLNDKFKPWLRQNRKYILQNWVYVFKPVGLSMRWKIKAACIFVRLYI